MRKNAVQSIISAIENAVDMIINLIAMVVSYLFVSLIIEPTVTFNTQTTILIFIFILISSFLYQAFDLNSDFPRGIRHAIFAVLKANSIFFGTLFAAVAIFGAEHGRPFLFAWLGLCAIISSAMLIFKKQGEYFVKRVFTKGSYTIRKVLIVGDNTAATEDFVKQIISQPEHSMMVIGCVGNKIDDKVGCKKLGSLAELDKILDEHRPSDVVFAMDAYDKHHIIRLVNICDDRCIRVYFLPVMYGYFKHPRQIEQVGTTPLINIHSTPLDSGFNAFIKRTMDVAVSALMLLVLSPLMIGAAIAVRISSPGPIFFRQERVGKMGRHFTMLKFRSMRVNVGSDDTWTRDIDPRKTRIGNFLRKTSIDELPQLFNVLGGSMSLVGPRPEVPYYVDYFKSRIPLYMIKHYAKPGITGLAQINGLRGDTSIDERIHKDIEYIENWSLWLDIKILLKTPLHAINKHEKYKKQDGELLGPTEDEAMLHDMERRLHERKLIIYVASTMVHIDNFHRPYIEKLREDGYTVKILAKGTGADFNIPFEKKMLSPINTACRRDIARIMREEKPTAVILNTSLAAFHVRLALPKLDRPRVINIVHGYLFSSSVGRIKRTVLTLCEKFMAKRTDAIIVMNSDDMTEAVKHRFTDGQIYMSRGMGAEIRPEKTPPARIREDFRLDGKYVISFVGDLSERKNQEFLIKAHAKLVKRIPEAVLLLVGDGSLREYYESVIDEFDLADSVILMGQREDACDVMRASDLYVSASIIEGMPFNIIEALGAGLPTLVSEVKGHTDLIEDRKSGFFFKPGEEDEYVDKICLIHSGVMRLDPENIHKRYLHFSKSEVLSETYSIIKEALQSGKN